jgi:hypothetical protein
METLQELHQRWKRLSESYGEGDSSRSGNDQGHPLDQIYRREFWPAVLEIWKSDPPRPPELKPATHSIHTLGTSPEATALAVLGAGARRRGDEAHEVHILHTQETRKEIPKLEDFLGKDFELRLHTIPKDDPVKIYKEIRTIAEEFLSGAITYIDITSGTKAMSAGVAAAAFFLQALEIGSEIRVIYVDNSDYDKVIRKPAPGSEYLVVLEGPLATLKDIDVVSASRTYTQGNYAKARDAFVKLYRHTKRPVWELWHLISDFYAKLAALDFAGAAKVAKTLASLLEEPWTQELLDPGERERLKGQLHLAQRAGQAGTDLKDREVAMAITSVLSWQAEGVSGALRALLVYRNAELLTLHLLQSKGYSERCADLTPEKREELKRHLESLFGKVKQDPVKLEDKFGLLDQLALLDLALQGTGPGIFEEHFGRLYQALSARNQNPLIHGLEAPSASTIEQLEGLVRRLKRHLGSPEVKPLRPIIGNSLLHQSHR